MKLRVQKIANIDPDTLKTIPADTLYHLYVDKENGDGEKEVASCPDTETMRNYIKMIRMMNGGAN